MAEMSARKRIEVLAQEERNELASAMATALETAKTDSWNNGLCALISQLESVARAGELVTIASVIESAKGLLRGPEK